MLVYPRPEISISYTLIYYLVLHRRPISLIFPARCVLTDLLRFLNHDIYGANE